MYDILAVLTIAVATLGIAHVALWRSFILLSQKNRALETKITKNYVSSERYDTDQQALRSQLREIDNRFIVTKELPVGTLTRQVPVAKMVVGIAEHLGLEWEQKFTEGFVKKGAKK